MRFCCADMEAGEGEVRFFADAGRAKKTLTRTVQKKTPTWVNSYFGMNSYK